MSQVLQKACFATVSEEKRPHQLGYGVDHNRWLSLKRKIP